jgi:3-dehydroquinate synthase
VETIVVDLGNRSYPIHVGEGLLERADLLAASIAAKQILVVTNDVVAPHYLGTLIDALPHPAASLVLPDGEVHKNLETFATIIDRLIDLGFHRDACIVALGGGVVGDLAGFAAASYQRGIDFVQIPTTLLAQVDSSVGGKTAVNHRAAKNMVGAFYQPSAVIADIKTLHTLPPRELAAGLAEVIKYGLIVDSDFLAWLESNLDLLVAHDPDALTHAIRRCCEIKAEIVAEDERERGRRALLNLGHTFGHALEAIGGYDRWLHGEAVAIGMSVAARVSAELGWLSAEDCERIDRLLARAGLPTQASDVDADRWLATMQLDKKADQRGLTLILLERIGHAVRAAAPDAELLRAVLTRYRGAAS